MIRDLFVPILRGRSDRAALEVAMALAVAHRAHLAALVTVENPIPLTSEWGYVPAELNEHLFEQARGDAEAVAVKAREQLAREAVSSEVRVTETVLLWSEETAALHARYADLTVMGGKDVDAAGPRFELNFKALLMHSGRPILLVPEGATLPVPVRRVVLAWQPTREATRALHDALPLLAGDAEVHVLMIDPEVGEARHGEQPGADIARHLARHGWKVRVVSQPREGRSDGQNLLAYVRDIQAELLVMGGYGHSRWRETVLGGATRSVVEGATTPVLFAH